VPEPMTVRRLIGPLVVASAFLAVSAAAEVRLEFDNLAFNAAKTFTFPVPKNLKVVSYSYAGRGNATLTVAACRVPLHMNDRERRMLGGGRLRPDQEYPKEVHAFDRDQRPEDQGCDWGALVTCNDSHGCTGVVTVQWETWGGPSSGGATEPPSQGGGVEPPAGGEATQSEPASGRSTGGGEIDLGDAGTLNNDAALVGYGCRIDGSLRKGDYDNFVFFFTGGPFRAVSSSGLNLVADLLD
jgi:hypothetical protein